MEVSDKITDQCPYCGCQDFEYLNDFKIYKHDVIVSFVVKKELIKFSSFF